MKRCLFFLLGIVMLLVGCSGKFEGPELVESATVMETYYTPPGHYQDTDWVLISTDDSFIRIPVPVTRTIPAKYAVAFKCQHGQFVINNDKAEDLYRRLARGQAVMVRYHEVFEVNDGRTNMVDLRFVDAVVRVEEPVRPERDISE